MSVGLPAVSEKSESSVKGLGLSCARAKARTPLRAQRKVKRIVRWDSASRRKQIGEINIVYSQNVRLQCDQSSNARWLKNSDDAAGRTLMEIAGASA